MKRVCRQCACSGPGSRTADQRRQHFADSCRPAGCVVQVPLDAVDPSRQSLLYTQGDQAAVSPIYDYDFSILYGAAAQSSWREILWCAISSVSQLFNCFPDDGLA